MSTYINVTTKQYPLHQGDIRLAVSGIGDSFVCPAGYAEVQESQPPSITANQYWLEEPPQEVNGSWVKQFRVIDMTPEEVAARDAWLAAEEAAKKPKQPNTDQPGSTPNVIG